MRRKGKRRKSFQTNLDPLMDILTCVVGVMLLVVIFAVMEAKGVTIKMITPLLRDPPANSERTIIICKDGELKPFDVDSAIKKFENEITVDLSDQSFLAELANEKKVNDDYFEYRFKLIDKQLFMICEPRKGVSGESIKDLKKGSSKFESLLKQLDENRIWFSFLIDSTSLDVFLEARKMAIEAGFSTGWDPKDVEFPYQECILGCTSYIQDGPGIARKTQ